MLKNSKLNWQIQKEASNGLEENNTDWTNLKNVKRAKIQTPLRSKYHVYFDAK